jgi:cytochrome c oxidase assembly protein subunit 15
MPGPPLEAPAFRVAARLGVLTTLSMFGLIVVGSVVRTTGSGLACPDWPLCHGRWLPTESLNVFLEWFHRLLALLTSAFLFTTAGWTLMRRDVRARLGALIGLAVLLLFAQVLLGALTVWKLLSPAVVSGHLAVGLLLFATLVTFTMVAGLEADPEAAPLPPRPAGLLPLLGGATAMVYVQAVLGGLVSTNGAALACPDWPTCNGQWLPPLDGLVGLQMTHRLGAYAVVAAMLAVAVRARVAPDPGIRAGAPMALGLTLTQAAFGVFNVLLGAPVWLSALHLATAAAILGLMVTLTIRAAALPSPERAPALAAAR